MKSWPRRWQTLVALFAEKRKGLKESVAPADSPGSSGDEFLCPDCGDVFPTLRRLKCHRGKAHKVRRPAGRFVRDGVLPRQLPLQDEGNGAFGERCEELQGGVDEGSVAGTHGGRAQRDRSRIGSVSQTGAL